MHLDDLDPFIQQNLDSKGWLPICTTLESSSAIIIREFHSNLFAHSAVSDGHFWITWIQGEVYQITKKVVADALSVPLVSRLTYPYTESNYLDDVMSLQW